MFPKILLSVIFLLGLLGSVLAVGELKITKDTSLGSDMEAYNSKCTFEKQPEDADFLKMIEAAFKEMQDIPGSRKEKQSRPSAMIGLSINNEVYFASSVRGKRQFIYEQVSWKGGDGTINPPLPDNFKEVTDALKSCADDHKTRPQHGNQASCGEIMSTLLWMVDNKNESPRDHNPKIAAYNAKGYLPPCASDPEDVKWGCSQWTQKMGLEVVQEISDLPDDYTKPEKTEPVQLAKCLEVEVDEDETTQTRK
ncbi:hypothetical protein N7489_008588 [Penicillium chrysogenum]|jgi:hypothetical protein|uniref:Secreted protein n=1 Tax=Penicillium chrysogenum TaxID=5076 RepID=A0ABQ8WZJ1_PENCH|nr:uncharacterized protein N7489_008588 [Penicillium chrysogenum]KAJ5227880.1 hypothetical protein N7489_008588 [Penicillium chrysogenum]KAJ5284488.1 hypothetical protein N7505_002468 [Penicillium chrysogenum]KAJ5286395.1 hypothetical protein N7524_001701 [Penicillium chrysogenum]